MGIFEFSRPENYSIISEEWQIFESVFPDTGAFKYISEKRTAYLDDNTYRILRLEKSKPDGSMSEKDFLIFSALLPLNLFITKGMFIIIARDRNAFG